MIYGELGAIIWSIMQVQRFHFHYFSPIVCALPTLKQMLVLVFCLLLVKQRIGTDGLTVRQTNM